MSKYIQGKRLTFFMNLLAINNQNVGTMKHTKINFKDYKCGYIKH